MKRQKLCLIALLPLTLALNNCSMSAGQIADYRGQGHMQMSAAQERQYDRQMSMEKKGVTHQRFMHQQGITGRINDTSGTVGAIKNLGRTFGAYR